MTVLMWCTIGVSHGGFPLHVAGDCVGSSPRSCRLKSLQRSWWQSNPFSDIALLLSGLLQFVAHPICQQVLSSIWCGSLQSWRGSNNATKVFISCFIFITMPILCLIYWIAPKSKVSGTSRRDWLPMNHLRDVVLFMTTELFIWQRAGIQLISSRLPFPPESARCESGELMHTGFPGLQSSYSLALQSSSLLSFEPAPVWLYLS